MCTICHTAHIADLAARAPFIRVKFHRPMHAKCLRCLNAACVDHADERARTCLDCLRPRPLSHPQILFPCAAPGVVRPKCGDKFEDDGFLPRPRRSNDQRQFEHVRQLFASFGSFGPIGALPATLGRKVETIISSPLPDTGATAAMPAFGVAPSSTAGAIQLALSLPPYARREAGAHT
jgi:hypothetical protein